MDNHEISEEACNLALEIGTMMEKRGVRANVVSVAAIILAVQGAQMGHISMRGFLALLVTVWDAVAQQEAKDAAESEDAERAEDR